jgi:hypothetical protein
MITTAPDLTHCYRCGGLVLAATVAGLDRHVDVDPLTQLGELAALLAGRPTYNLSRELLVRRSPERIRHGEPGTVLAEHNCTPTPPEHVDGAHMTAAIWLVQHILGAEIVEDTNPAPPF